VLGLLAFAAHLPACIVADAELVTPLDTRRVLSGDSFVFRTLSAVVATSRVPAIPAGTKGYGVIAFAQHAGARGQPGRIVFEPRFLRLPGDVHVPAMADPHLTDEIAEGSSRNAPDIGIVPLVSVFVGAYNELHRGREIVVPAGTPLRVIIGDDLALKRCSDPPASDF
jgi:hypothetical protein